MKLELELDDATVRTLRGRVRGHGLVGLHEGVSDADLIPYAIDAFLGRQPGTTQRTILAARCPECGHVPAAATEE
jgi:hypothetical protein